MRRKVHYVIEPQYLWGSIAEMARTQDDELLNNLQKGFKYIEEESFASTFRGLFSGDQSGVGQAGQDLRRAQCPSVQDHRRDCQGAGAVLYR